MSIPLNENKKKTISCWFLKIFNSIEKVLKTYRNTFKLNSELSKNLSKSKVRQCANIPSFY